MKLLIVLQMIVHMIGVDMKIDFKYIVGILGTIVIGLSTWTLVSIVDLKESNSYIKGELFQINKDIGRLYNYINSKMK